MYRVVSHCQPPPLPPCSLDLAKWHLMIHKEHYRLILTCNRSWAGLQSSLTIRQGTIMLHFMQHFPAWCAVYVTHCHFCPRSSSSDSHLPWWRLLTLEQMLLSSQMNISHTIQKKKKSWRVCYFKIQSLLWLYQCHHDDTSILNPTEALMSAAVYLSQLLKEMFGAAVCVVVHLSVWH